MIKATGVVRKVDELGRVVIPIELRRNLGINEKDGLEIFVGDGEIVLKKYHRGCRECGNVEVDLFGKSELCSPCLDKLAKEARR